MKTLKKLLLVAFISLPLLAVPNRSKAGGLDDLWNWLFGDGNSQGDKKHHGDDDGNKHHGDNGGNGGNWNNGGNGGNCGGGGSNPGGGGGNSVPINGGLVILFAAGLGLGAKVISDKTRAAAQDIQ